MTDHHEKRADRGVPDKAAPKDAAATSYGADQVVTPPASPPLVGGKEVEVLMGPYRGLRLVMPEAEADTAIVDHWAVDPYDPNADHAPLTDIQRDAALTAANDWAAAATAPPPAEAPPEGRRHVSR
jgi:hypothetical protein